jgi:hypothetical protein
MSVSWAFFDLDQRPLALTTTKNHCRPEVFLLGASETEKRFGDATCQAQDEFARTFEEMSRAVMSRATAEIELGVKLTQRFS